MWANTLHNVKFYLRAVSVKNYFYFRDKFISSNSNICMCGPPILIFLWMLLIFGYYFGSHISLQKM